MKWKEEEMGGEEALALSAIPFIEWIEEERRICILLFGVAMAF